VPLYDIACPDRHHAEVLQPYAAPLPPCAVCGQPTRRVPSAPALLGQVRLPPRAEMMPQTWKGTYGGDRDYVTELRRTAAERTRLEERHPELAGDQRPVLAHEGAYHDAPLRAGDQQAGPAAAARTHGHPHAHPHPTGP
jgi:hypothetical protein